MFNLHKTRNGQVMLIAQMEDEHLINTIKYLCTEIKNAATVLENTNFKGSVFLNAIRPEVSQEITEQANYTIKNRANVLLPYIMEASLRGLQISAILQDTFDRSMAVPNFNTMSAKNSLFSVNSNKARNIGGWEDCDGRYFDPEDNF